MNVLHVSIDCISLGCYCKQLHKINQCTVGIDNLTGAYHYNLLSFTGFELKLDIFMTLLQN